MQRSITPTEQIEEAYTQLKNELASELLDKVKAYTPAFFERLVVDLLLKMGYGGSLSNAGWATKLSGDGGIDGIINQDPLGLDVVYIQAKRWEGSVGSPEIHKFVGALSAKKTKKGVFITTSTFTKGAVEYISTIDFKIILIDGKTLTDLMIVYEIGTATQSVYEVKRIDSDYFEEEYGGGERMILDTLLISYFMLKKT